MPCKWEMGVGGRRGLEARLRETEAQLGSQPMRGVRWGKTYWLMQMLQVGLKDNWPKAPHPNAHTHQHSSILHTPTLTHPIP